MNRSEIKRKIAAYKIAKDVVFGEIKDARSLMINATSDFNRQCNRERYDELQRTYNTLHFTQTKLEIRLEWMDKAKKIV